MVHLFQGIECSSPSAGTFICKKILLCGTAHLPARSILCNHIQYNGAFSCRKCEQEGKTATVGKGHAGIFLYDDETQKALKEHKRTLMKILSLLYRPQKLLRE